MAGNEPGPGEDWGVIDFVQSITDSARLRIEENLPHGFVRLKVAEAERRQAQHDIRSVEDIVTELVRNSRDAGAVHVLVASQKEQGRLRKITVIDDGCGIPEDMHLMVFEPRVTSKSKDFEEDRFGVHGRGMALFSIRSRASDTHIAKSEPGLGTSINLTVDTSDVPERADQATVPQLEQVDSVEDVGVGPHNMVRALLEMSVDSPEIDFYHGSFAEVLATLRALGIEQAGEEEETLWSALSRTHEAQEITRISGELGLPVSERTAYRVLGSDVSPLPCVYELASRRNNSTEAEVPVEEPGSAPRRKGRNPLKRVNREDLERIGELARDAAAGTLGEYFLRTSGQPTVRRGRGKLVITFYVTGEGEDEG